MEEPMKTKVLLVEDSEDLRLITLLQLEQLGYDSVGAATGQEALEILSRERIDIILLDVMLPDCDGHELCVRMRNEPVSYGGPVIFLSCLGDGENIVEAFRNGGTDYIVKPAKADILRERIEINLEKVRKPDGGSYKKRWFRHFMVDPSKREVYAVEDGIQKDKILLSPKEYQLLESMIDHEGEILFYRQLYRDVWGQDDLDDVRTLMVHVSNLRKKISPENVEIIRAIRGVGYLFQDD